jgi:DNA-binding NarL/FixJ family response regulator
MSSKCIAEVFLVAENRLLREALVRLLAKKDIRVVGANLYSPAVIEEIARRDPDVILLDSTGLLPTQNVLSAIRAAIPGAKVVMVDMDSDENMFLKAVRGGVVGYVLKDASAGEVAATIRSVAAGEAVCPPMLSVALFRCVSQQTAPVPIRLDSVLSRREQQLVELLSDRLTNKEIATHLNLSEQTVKNHVHNILRKLGANDRVRAIQLYEADRGRATRNAA